MRILVGFRIPRHNCVLLPSRALPSGDRYLNSEQSFSGTWPSVQHMGSQRRNGPHPPCSFRVLTYQNQRPLSQVFKDRQKRVGRAWEWCEQCGPRTNGSRWVLNWSRGHGLIGETLFSQVQRGTDENPGGLCVRPPCGRSPLGHIGGHSSHTWCHACPHSPVLFLLGIGTLGSKDATFAFWNVRREWQPHFR